MTSDSRNIRSFLNRYTSLPVLLDVLSRKCITLLSPASWEDRNDSFYLERYKEERNLKTVLALCFTTERETFHHWKIFSSGASGVCIEFRRELFLKEIEEKSNFLCRDVVYKMITDVETNIPPLGDWPFLKRRPFRDEKEFRIVYENTKVVEKTKDVPFDVGCIRQITLSPWLPESVVPTVIRVIRSVEGCQKIRIIRSTLIENTRWKEAIAKK
jgi:hypothetical protein